MASLMPQGKQQYVSSTGAPLVGGKVYTYAAGTTTLLATYTDAGGSTPNTNPVILDSRGEASIFFSNNVYYKIVLKDSADATIWTQDNLPGNLALAALAASSGSSLVGFIQSGTGAVATTVQTKLRENVSVFDFMTAAQIADVQAETALVDVTTVVQAAITSLSTSGGQLLFPRGKYKISSTLNLVSNVKYVGQGNTTLQITVSEVGLQLPAAASNIEISGFIIGGTFARAISCNYGGTATKIRIYGNTISGATLAGAGYTSGIFMMNATDCIVEANKLSGNGLGTTTAFHADISFYAPAAGTQNSRNKILNNQCSSGVGFNIQAFNLDHSEIAFNICKGALTGSGNNNGYGIVVYDVSSYTLSYSTTSFNVISNNVVTNTQGTGIYIASADNCIIANNICAYNGTVQTDASLPVGGIAINGPYCSQTTVTGNDVSSSGKDGIVVCVTNYSTVAGNTVSASGQHGIQIRGACSGVTISGNTITSSTQRGIYDNVTAKTYLSISGNTVYGSTLAGIEIGGSTKSSIANNVSSGNATYGILNGGSYNSIVNNVLTGNTIDGMSGINSGNTRRGNKYTDGDNQGSKTLVAGAATVSTTEVRTGDVLLITRGELGGTAGHLSARNIISGTSFVLDSSSGTDTASVYWEILH
jgi:parallel beta-helix repeat protein